MNAKNILSTLASGKTLSDRQLDFLKDNMGELEPPKNYLETPLKLAEFRQLTGLTPRRIQQLKTEGVITDRGRGSYYFTQVAEYISYQARLVEKRKIKAEPAKGDLNPEQERARKDKLSADKLELEIKMKREELVDAHELESEFTSLALEVKNRMLSLPSLLAPRLELEDNAREIEQIIDKEVREALSAVASAE